MVSLRLSTGEDLVLPAYLEANIDLLQPATTEDIEESYSLPFTIPVRGNEVALQYVHLLELAERRTYLENVEFLHNGIPIHTGQLKLLKVVDGGVSASFNVDGMLATVRDKPLRECDFGPAAFHPDMVAHAVDVNTGTWPEQRYCFPPFLNKEFYGDRNPQWYPDPPVWNVSTNFDTDDLCQLKTGDTVQRNFIWQATADSQFGYPSASSEWRLTAFGICNHWDHDGGTFFINDTINQNYYNLVPCLYLKYLVERAAAAAGLTCTGDWYTDSRHHRAILAGNTALDGIALEHYFNVGIAAPYTVSGGSGIIGSLTLPCDDESTGDFEDADGVWDNTTFEFTPNEAGLWTFYLFVRSSGNVTPYPGVWAASTGYGDPAGFKDISPNLPIITTNDAGETEYYIEFTCEFDLADVGVPFIIEKSYYGGTVLHEIRLTGFIQSEADINTFSNRLNPAHHAPDLTVGELLQHVRDAFCLELVVNRADATLTLNYRRDELTKAQVDMSAQRVAPIAIDMDRRNLGYKFAFDVDAPDLPDLSQLTLAQTVDSEADLTEAPGPHVYALDRGTRKVYLPERPYPTSGALPNYWVWVSRGTFPSTALVGDEEKATRITCAFKPPEMERQLLDGEWFMMPTINQPGNSMHFKLKDNAFGLFLMYYHGVIDNGNGADGPVASPYRYNQDGSTISSPEFDWIGADGLFANEWEAWANAINGAEPVNTALVFTHAQILNNQWRAPYYIDNQVYLPVRIPLRYGRGPLLATNCELLLLKPPVA